MTDHVAEPAPPAFDFADPVALTRWVRVLLGLHMLAAVIDLMVTLPELQSLNAAPGTAQATPEDALVRLLQLLTFLSSGVLVLMWIHRANYNVRQLGATDLQYTPGWAVAWYFVPISNLWRPYRVMIEICQASAHLHSRGPIRKRPTLLRNWWQLWLVSNIMATLSLPVLLRPVPPERLKTAYVQGVIAAGFELALCLSLLQIVNWVHSMQMGALQARKVSPPHPTLAAVE